MKIDGILKKGKFHRRNNRFIAEVIVEGELVKAHVPNTGRLKELLIEGADIVLQYIDSPKRKTQYELILVQKKGILVSIDSQLPNRFLEGCIQQNKIPELHQYTSYKREVTFGKSRFDFYMQKDGEGAFMEVKGCTLVEDEICLFPDAPTERGTKHVKELIEARRQGYAAYLFFLIQRGDAKSFTTNDAMDPEFGKAVRDAQKAGVNILCYNTCIEGDHIYLRQKIEVLL